MSFNAPSSYTADALARDEVYQDLKARLCASLYGAAYDTAAERDLRRDLDEQMAAIRDRMQGINVEGQYVLARDGQPVLAAPRFNSRREALSYLAKYPGSIGRYTVLDLAGAGTVERAA